jgi:hypothetical protein
MKKNFKILGMSYEDYQEMKHRQLVKRIMKANGWNENEYEEK